MIIYMSERDNDDIKSFATIRCARLLKDKSESYISLAVTFIIINSLYIYIYSIFFRVDRKRDTQYILILIAKEMTTIMERDSSGNYVNQSFSTVRRERD